MLPPVPGRWDWVSLRRCCVREARRFFSNRDDAEDVAQEALLRAWRKRSACATPGDPRPWVLAIARNEALRRLGRRDEAPLATPPERSDLAANEQLEATPARMDVRAALAELGADDRSLLKMRYAEDLTQPAVADALGLPEGTVKVRLHRLRRRLQERLEEQ
jgi:RNA polymerase sigma-70 factor (ECF subfamily)